MGCGCGGGSRATRLSTTATTTSTRTLPPGPDDGTVWELTSRPGPDGTVTTRRVHGRQQAFAVLYSDTDLWRGIEQVT